MKRKRYAEGTSDAGDDWRDLVPDSRGNLRNPEKPGDDWRNLSAGRGGRLQDDDLARKARGKDSR